MWLLDRLLRAVVHEGPLIVVDHDGSLHHYGTGGDPLTIRLTAPRTAWRIASDPGLGAGEAYMDGELVVDPPHDIRDLVLLFKRNANRRRFGSAPPNPLRRLVDWVAWRLDQINTRARIGAKVRHHYDLTRQFYELFLDEDRQYTMAYWADPDGTLEQAQRDKKALIAAKLRLDPARSHGLRVLDIGCGWGGLGLFLHRHYGCEVLGVSLAPDQVRFANERAAAAGVADKVRFELIDYRDVTGTFDRITSVGMIEHVGAGNFTGYFAKTFDLLADDGIMLTHTIGRTSGPGRTDAWTRKHVFPGGYIPALSELVTACEQTGWQTGDCEVLRFHYALTLQEWYRRTCAHRAEIVALYDERLFRMWQFYLAGAEQAFRSGGMVNLHLQTVKRQGVLPMTRDYIAAEAARLIAAEPVPDWHLSVAAE
ncbi:class I SAM-dependent methyltransferase [Novosphingobium piscinae]|uniref:Class I SAM-dependent methyltransferase n=1 Tax=Novosphingobium piscinae TaxID=1507448 RepID=A0A7X1FVV2_9SPHN|nr:cyclopropane-fatty-acyl-phospholipid synthase family protein [Novosphingobium piscinae]MBC2667940.1 class I SAM-dependent methyltransferase [Novosphingobium piscinae]